MKEIKCNFKNLKESDKKIFSVSSCLLLISVGQQAHEDGYFSSTIDLVNRNFGSCTIALYDSLQRYTMALSSSDDVDKFHALANLEGDYWLERNATYYNKLDIPFKITRWDEWLNHSLFQLHRNILKEMIECDASYEAIFEMAINKYLMRASPVLKQHDNFDLERAKKLCFDYILEECTVLCLWPELNGHFEIYPSIHNEAMEETRRRFIYPKYNNLLRPLTIRFRGGEQFQRQEFYLSKSSVANE